MDSTRHLRSPWFDSCIWIKSLSRGSRKQMQLLSSYSLFRAGFTWVSKVILGLLSDVKHKNHFVSYRNWIVERGIMHSLCDISWTFVVSRHHSYAFFYKILVWVWYTTTTRQKVAELALSDSNSRNETFNTFLIVTDLKTFITCRGHSVLTTFPT